MQYAWDNLVDELQGEVFLTYDWLRVWWAHYHRGRALLILVFERRGELIGLIPLCREELGWGPWRLSLLRTLGTDYTPVAVSLLVRPPELEAVADAFMRDIASNADCSLIVLGPSAGKCPASRQFFQHIQSVCPGRAMWSSAGEQTYFDVAGDWEGQVARLSYRERNRMRGMMRKLDAAGLRLHSDDATGEQLSLRMHEFIEAHQEKWTALGQGGHFHDWPDAKAFHLEMARIQHARGRLRLLKIMLNDQPVGFKYAYKTGRLYCSYLDAHGVDFTGLGLDVYRLNFRELARHGMSEGVRLIDSMRGRYEHKLHLGGRMEPCHRLVLRAPGLRVRVLAALWRGRASLERIIYVALWRRRVRPRLQLRPRPFRESWIRLAALAARS